MTLFLDEQDAETLSSVSMSWIIAVAVLSIVGLIAVMFSLAVPKFKVLQKLIDKLNLVSRENLSGMMVIRAFGNESYEERRFEQANDQLRKTNRFVQRTMAFLFPAMTLVICCITTRPISFKICSPHIQTELTCWVLNRIISTRSVAPSHMFLPKRELSGCTPTDRTV